MKASEIRDFELTGDEDTDDIEQWADDYISECESDLAEYRETQQERYDTANEHAIRQSEMIEIFRNEY